MFLYNLTIYINDIKALQDVTAEIVFSKTVIYLLYTYVHRHHQFILVRSFHSNLGGRFIFIVDVNVVFGMVYLGVCLYSDAATDASGASVVPAVIVDHL